MMKCWLCGREPAPTLVASVRERLARAERDVLDERERGRVFAVEWHARSREVTHLQSALRRANRRIKAQKAALDALRERPKPTFPPNRRLRQGEIPKR